SGRALRGGTHASGFRFPRPRVGDEWATDPGGRTARRLTGIIARPEEGGRAGPVRRMPGRYHARSAPGDSRMSADLTLDADAAIDRLMRFLSVEGVTGREKAIAREVAQALKAAGVPAPAIKHDRAHERIPLPTQTGNLIVTLPGTRPGPRLLFSTHLDT